MQATAKRKTGRPRSNPKGSNPRTIRVTDSEFKMLIGFLKVIRSVATPSRPDDHEKICVQNTSSAV
jgi:hypothetical protein